MEVFTSEEMRAIDLRAEQDHQIPTAALMDNAGRQIARFMMRRHPDLASRKLAILCGKGNNGGDGVTAARHLRKAGISSDLFLMTSAASLSGAAAGALAQSLAAGIQAKEILSEEAWSRLAEHLSDYDLVLDALMGTGARGGARGLMQRAIQDIRRSGVEVISVDIPSGLSGSSHQVPEDSITASATAVLAGLKIANALEPARSACGAVELLDIGIPQAAFNAERPALQLVTPEHVAGLLPVRSPSSHKGNYGHVLILAGSRGKSGAAMLMGEACLRSGAGLVTIACPASVQESIATALPEAMTAALPEDDHGMLAGEAADQVLSLLQDRDVLAAGPGLGTGPGVIRTLLELIPRIDKPSVFDADALNIFAANPELALQDRVAAIFTPHPGEAARLLSSSSSRVQEDRPAAARELAARLGGTVILKGHQSLIATAGQPVQINETGNPGMATAGSGDVLAGICAAWLAQGHSAENAALLSTFVHGMAGDRAAVSWGQISLTAGDIIEHLPDAHAALGESRER